MGQRHQYIVIYPEMNLNEGNCNNKPERAEVIHHQWLYGFTAIRTLDRVLRLAANCWDGKGTDYMFGRDKNGYTGGDGTRAIAAAMSVDPDSGYYHNASIWEPADWNGMEGNRYRGGYVTPQNLKPGMFDNNDGITLIRFKRGERLPSYAFITPGHLEGKHWKCGKGPWTALQYLKFYYSDEELAKFAKEDLKTIIEALERINKNSQLLTVAEIRELLPNFKGFKELRRVKEVALA